MQYSVNNTRLNVLELGSGLPALLFLHYFGGSAMEWPTVMGQLADNHRCLAVDLRGHGDSAAPDSGYSVGDMADDIQALIQELALEEYVLIGHSMSGKVALELASRQPAGLQKVLLVSPSPPEPELIPAADRQDMIETHGQQKAAEETADKITAKPLPDRARNQIITDNLRTADVAWRAWLTLGSKENISPRMSAVRVPVRIIVGTKDKAIAPEVQQTMTLPHLPTATLTEVDGAGHLLPYETPDALTAFIRHQLAD